MKKISFIVLSLLLICIPFSLSATLQKQPEQVVTENTTRLVSSPVTIDRTITTFPWTEDFEGATWPPADWVVIESATSNAIIQDTGNNHTTAGTASLRFSSYNSAGDYTEYARTPEIALTGLSNPLLSFWFKKEYSWASEELYVAVGTNSDVTTFTGWTQMTLSADWASYEMDLSAYNGQNIYIGFKYFGDYAYYVYLDDVSIVNNVTPPPCCTTFTPTDASVDVLESGLLTWDMASGATSYEVNIGTSAGNYDIVSGMTVTGTSYGYSGLSYGQTYYWSIAPSNANGTATGCSELSFTVRNDPTITTLPWTEDFTTWPPTNWNLLGGTQTWSQYTNTNPVVECAKANFWSWSMPNDAYMTTPPIQIPATGNWLFAFDWSHLYDSNYPDDQGILEISTDGLTWTELWNLANTAFESNDGAGSSAPGSFTNEVYSLASYAGQTAYFRFHAVSGYGPDFFVDNVQIINGDTAPACASVQNPSDMGTDVLEFGTLAWSEPVGAESYALYMGTSAGNYDIINGTVITQTSVTYNGLNYGSTYYWMVVPANSFGSATGCPEWSFTTRADPTISTFPHHVDFETTPNWLILAGTGTWTIQSWAATSGPTADHTSGSGNFAVFADNNPYGTVNVGTLQTTPFDISTMSAPTLNFWYWLGTAGSTEDQSTLYLDVYDGSSWNEGVTSYGLNGQWESVSVDLTAYASTGTTFRFRAVGTTTDQSSIGIDDFAVFDNVLPPSCTANPAPADVAVDQLDSGTLSWDDTFNTSNYLVYIGTSTGSYNIVNGMSVTGTSCNYFLSPGTTYYWMVTPGNNNGYATGCPEWSFSTIAVTPDCATYVAPADAAIDQIEFGTLDWDSADYASYYNLYLGTASGNYDVVNGMTITTTYYDYSGLTYGGTYYWMVVPANGVGPATGCTEQSFTVRADPTITTLPWLEEFTTWGPTDWFFSGDRSWGQYNSEAAYCNFWGWNSGTAVMTTPPVVLPSTGMYALYFDWSHQYNASYPNDQGIVQISTDNGANWTELWNLTGTAFESNDGAQSTAPGSYANEMFPLDTYLGETVIFQVIGNSGYGPDFFIDNFGVNTYVPPTAKAKVNVFLGGCYSADVDEMNATLNSFLPLTSPYTDGIAVTAMPTEVVDWISVELRQTADGATIEQRSGLLLMSGMIVDVAYETDNTVDYVNFTTATAGDYFVVLRHRNHSDIMSAVAATLPADPTAASAVDFTSDAANAYSTGPAPVYEVETGVYAMYPGDINGDGSIIADDATIWQAAFTSGTPDGYNIEDLDFDSSVLAADNVVWKTHFSAGAPDSQVPDNSATATTIFSRSSGRTKINRNTQKVNKTLKLN